MQTLEDGGASPANEPPLGTLAWQELATSLVAAQAANHAQLLRGRPLANPAPLVQELCRLSLAAAREEPGRALPIASAALAAARSARTSALPASVRADLRAEAWAHLANALRVQERYREATRAWKRAHHLRLLGSRDPLLAALLAEMEALLRRAQRQLPTAAKLLARAIRTYRNAATPNTPLGRALHAASTVAYAHGDATSAYRLAFEALQATPAHDQPTRYFRILRDSVLYLAELGELGLALRMVRELAPWRETIEGETARLRWDWICGRVFSRCGAWEQAQELFERVCRGFAAQGLHYDAALVAFDICWSYAEKGRWAKVCELAVAMNDTFCSLAIPREAAAAFSLFLQAASNFRVGWPVLHEVQSVLAPLRRERGF